LQNFVKNIAVEYGGAAVAASSSTDSNSSRFDMQGYESVIAITTITDSTDTGTATLSIQENSADSDTGMTEITGATLTATSAADDDLNGKFLMVEVVKPIERYVQATRVSATANMAFGEVYVIRIKSRKKPVAAPSTQAAAPVVVAGS
jgi:hypothetical protein